jgi:putative membrane protein
MPLKSLATGLLVLAAAWLGPLPSLASHAFSAHMTMHLAVVAIAAPLLAYGVAGTRFDPVRVAPRIFSPVPASAAEFAVVWAWHAPALYQAARHEPTAFAAEQLTFLVAGVWLWISVLGGEPHVRLARAATGVVVLLLTSMHMTLLGALLALGPRPLYGHSHDSLSDQHLGGALMLLVGGAVYLAGGLWLMTGLVRALGPTARERT